MVVLFLGPPKKRFRPVFGLRDYRCCQQQNAKETRPPTRPVIPLQKDVSFKFSLDFIFFVTIDYLSIESMEQLHTAVKIFYGLCPKQVKDWRTYPMRHYFLFLFVPIHSVRNLSSHRLSPHTFSVCPPPHSQRMTYKNTRLCNDDDVTLPSRASRCTVVAYSFCLQCIASFTIETGGHPLVTCS
jgi:hypothetical protein